MAGYTTVTGTVLDPTGRVYQNGAFNFSFVNGPTGKQPTLANGQSFELSISGSLDSFGFFSVPLADNGIIAATSGATGTSWYFSICANGNILGLPAGAPVPCFNYTSPIICASNTPNTCSGTTIDISAQLKAVAALLPNPTGVFTGAPTLFAGVPTGPCAATQTAVNTLTGDLYDCVSTAWFKVGPGGVPLNAALKPTLPGDPVQYVSSNGNDANDGLSWGTARLTVYKALQSLPGGTSTTAGSGTVLLSGDVAYGGPVANQGMWIMGASDPNSAAPPSGWLLKSGPINIECVNKNRVAANGHTATCRMGGGGNTDLLHPALWLSATATVTLKNIGFSDFRSTYAKIGIDSNNNRTTSAGGVSSIVLDGVSWNHGTCGSGGGPGIDIGSNSFWIFIQRVTGTGCAPGGAPTIAAPGTPGLSRSSGVVTVTTTTSTAIAAGATQLITIQNAANTSFNGSFAVASVISGTQFTYSQVGPDATSGNGQVITYQQAAVNIDPGGGTGKGGGSGLIFIDEWNFNSGGVRLVAGTGGGGVYIRNGTFEGNNVDAHMPPVLVPSSVLTSSGIGMNVHVDNLEVADNVVPVPGVQIDNATVPFAVVSRVDAGVKGAALLLGGTPVYDSLMSGLRAGQAGYGIFGRITGGGIDAARRGFSPVAVISPNLANTAPASWVFEVGVGTITTGISAPDGTTGAGRVTSNAGTSIVDFYVNNNTPLTIGDAYIYGVWERSNSGGALSGNVKLNLNSSGFGAGDTCAPFSGLSSGGVLFGQTAGDGQWIWNSGLCKVYTNPVNAGITLTAMVTNPSVMDFYGPTLIKIPAGTKSDNELFEIANNLSIFSSAAASGEVSMFGGQRFRPGMTTFANIGPAPVGVTFIGCSDCTIANPCAGGGTGALAKSLNSIWVCN